MDKSIYIDKFMKGDSDSFNYIYNKYYNKIYFLCLSILRNETDSLDATQEVFIQIYKSIAKLKDKSKFDFWINKIAISKCSNIIRKNKKLLLVGDDLEIYETYLEEDSLDNPENLVVNSDEKVQILKIINKLSPKKRIVIILFYYNSLKIKEISDLLKCSEGTVKSRLNSARIDIKNYLEKDSVKTYNISFPGIFVALKEIEFNKVPINEVLKNISNINNRGFNFRRNNINIFSKTLNITNIFYILFISIISLNLINIGKRINIMYDNSANKTINEKLRYSVTDSDGNTTVKERIVNIKKDYPPEILGADDKTIKVGEQFNEFDGVYARDDIDASVSSKVIGKVDVNKQGKYTIKYIAKDSKGNTSIKYRIINVER
ncbi:sigma-70 family RNA polymerase sigma factor [Clostridium sardiniense]|uniref:Sigma-70 family RNA polymerase sigma factor n=1 Tax=Clostridium sardiniense TaxID=29369 RepID=A0ABS7L0X5_CLOSR|nr:sigma-70 family RNA polymerase sigma factor [Clostridium sardiniense]MBY0756719.1 sigma-70 family RNA polymerase sigma factor [Clostridium sardiniense]MDQ0460403.1 RNA polymerase sigma factor (sigma-70 family) [Clostridium sardiniense]